MQRRPVLVVAALLLGAALARAGEPADKLDLVALARDDNQVMEHLDHLANKIGPRLTGSSNIEKAYEWTRSEFERFGLQNAHTETWSEWPVRFDRGTSSGKLLAAAGERKLTFGTYAWTAGTNGPVRGPVLYAPRTPDELAAVKDKLKGAWLLARGRSRQQDASVRKALDEAGIAGRVVSSGSDLIHTDGSPRGITMQKLPTRVQINITKADYQAIVQLLDKKEPCELEFDIQNRFSAGPIENKNVIADIPGVEHPDEFVIVGGHLDSWDGATGATDNGTGVATTLEAARLLVKAGVHPRRTIRFILWSGEEQGLLGSAGYVKKHKAELPKVSCVLVHDGGTNYVSGIGATKPMMPLVEPALAHLGWDSNMPFKVHQVKHLPYGVGSDHDTFLGLGVPGFFWDQSGTNDYEHGHHTQFDTFDVAIPEYQKHSAIVIAQGALAMANLDQLLPREDLLPPMGERPQGKMLGVQCDPELLVEHVVEGSLAETAGVQEGDKLISLAGKKLESVADLRAAVQASVGEVELVFTRDGKEVHKMVTFAEAKKKRWL